MKPRKHTADELRELKAKLVAHRGKLVRRIVDALNRWKPVDPDADFKGAVCVRDLAQDLTLTCSHLTNIDMFIRAAERDGSVAWNVDLDEIGLEAS